MTHPDHPVRYYVVTMSRDAEGTDSITIPVPGRTRSQAETWAIAGYREKFKLPPFVHVHYRTLKALRTAEEAVQYLDALTRTHHHIKETAHDG